jgi:hypothetical protein
MQSMGLKNFGRFFFFVVFGLGRTAFAKTLQMNEKT